MGDQSGKIKEIQSKQNEGKYEYDVKTMQLNPTWTYKLAKLIYEHRISESTPLKANIMGPYSSSFERSLGSDVAVLIGSGTGIACAESVLQALVDRFQNDNKSFSGKRVELVLQCRAVSDLVTFWWSLVEILYRATRDGRSIRDNDYEARNADEDLLSWFNTTIYLSGKVEDKELKNALNEEKNRYQEDSKRKLEILKSRRSNMCYETDITDIEIGTGGYGKILKGWYGTKTRDVHGVQRVMGPCVAYKLPLDISKLSQMKNEIHIFKKLRNKQH